MSSSVAPYVGAWIETGRARTPPLRRKVAPYVGAWIETSLRASPWMIYEVAPYVGAWIETELASSLPKTDQSHPTWVRGLKPSK